MVYEKHHRAETIINKGRIPKVWLTHYENKFSRIDGESVDDERVRPLEIKSKKKLLRDLDHLIGYFQKSPLLHDRETRQMLLSRLEEARYSWEQMNWNELSALMEDP